MEKKNLAIEEFELKTDGDEAGIFTGYGSTFGGKPDSYGDVIAKGAFSETLTKGGVSGLGVAMLWQHDMSRPIGTYLEASENGKGLKLKGQIAINSTDGKNMFELMKIKAVKGLSIGFGAVESEYDHEKGIRTLTKIDLYEVSPVVFPANNRATITNVKSIIEDAKNPRDFENGLREAGLSKNAAEYIVSLCKDKLFEKKSDTDSMKKIYEGLTQLNSELESLKK